MLLLFFSREKSMGNNICNEETNNYDVSNNCFSLAAGKRFGDKISGQKDTHDYGNNILTKYQDRRTPMITGITF